MCDGPERAPGLEEEDPAPVEEEEDREHNLDGVPEGLDVKDPVVKRLPHSVLTEYVDE